MESQGSCGEAVAEPAWTGRGGLRASHMGGLAPGASLPSKSLQRGFSRPRALPMASASAGSSLKLAGLRPEDPTASKVCIFIRYLGVGCTQTVQPQPENCSTRAPPPPQTHQQEVHLGRRGGEAAQPAQTRPAGQTECQAGQTECLPGHSNRGQ